MVRHELLLTGQWRLYLLIDFGLCILLLSVSAFHHNGICSNFHRACVDSVERIGHHSAFRFFA